MSPARFVDLSHRIDDGMVTYPGLPGPRIDAHLTFDASQKVYAPGTEFQIGRIEMVGNTGTYIDAPQHRYRDGSGLADIALEQVAAVPGVVIDDEGPVIEPGPRLTADLAGHAVLFGPAGHATGRPTATVTRITRTSRPARSTRSSTRARRSSGSIR